MKQNKHLLCVIVLLILSATASGTNPFLPLWEHIPDGEPYIFEDPDNPGKKRVYIYGSHDMLRNMYCGTDLVVWSASVDSLDSWRYDGIILEVRNNGVGKPLHGDGRGDVLYAPDVTERILPDGRKEYYLYPNNQGGGRNGMVAKSERPDGPFEVINWNTEKPDETVGVLAFDPAVFIDDDGRVYGYWGFGRSYAAELDPLTMATVKPGTETVADMVSGFEQDGIFRFFEASSIRKIEDKYVFIYSRMTEEGEWGLPQTNYTLAYAYSDNPLGPFTYGGTIIDARGRDTDADGQTIPTATPMGNTHGSILCINGQWWVFYHRQSGTDEFARQAMVAPIEVSVIPGPGGKVTISEGEYTSEGFETAGLNPLCKYPAAIASHYTGPRPVTQKYPNICYTGPYVQPTYITDHAVTNPYDPEINMNPVVNNTDGSILGYKYFNFDKLTGISKVKLLIDIIPGDVDGTISVYAEAPWKGRPSPIGKFSLKANSDKSPRKIHTRLRNIEELRGKHPLYLVFASSEKDKSVCTLRYLQFLRK
ncbi:MAG: family 43 glycosylhydrolase [Prevotella sp.]|nr:family 43 glycosylhydrolase [Prevotella sp.]